MSKEKTKAKTKPEVKPKEKYTKHGIRILIDWAQAEELLMAGCTAIEIAAHFGVELQNLYFRCSADRKHAWSYFAKTFYEKGNSLLKLQQFKLAMKGDRLMLLWLGKQRLGQKEQVEHKKEIPEDIKEFVELLKANGPNQITLDSKTNELIIDENYVEEVKDETTQ